MNQSLWYEQIDGALIEFISDNIKLDGVPAHVFVRKPEEEFDKITFPCVTIYNLSTKPHQSREDVVFGSLDSRDTEGNTISYKAAPVLYEHVYQLDFWARFQSQMNEMTYQWFSKVEKDANVSAQTQSGTSVTFYLVQERGLQKSDLISGKERLFHSFLSYTVFADIDTQEIETIPMIKEVEVTNEENF